MSINNPITQLANLFNLVEARLRRAAAEKHYIGLSDLMKDPDINAAAKDHVQVKNVLKTFRDHGHLYHIGTSRWTTYIWNVDSPPFVLGKRIERRKKVDPSEPVIVNSDTAAPNLTKLGSEAAPPKEIELVFGKNQIVIGTNPATGRMRIIIEETP